ncbi:MAG: T9SS type A sorting domain-containing protein [Flavobacteriales bacterium]|jgi:hypothetical protein|nr:T9SS type A sorting domain-containing protein [Flavobacteriales bacterium]MBK6550152.1 T9SS type A sorting domain-containing protein [Flavobacteriales bacterium]MBK6881687.1 T9SS type A sorting domain-containing protein [Flavobacteriales bacterium]MBK7102662.1 T9SS type A sorting domain-containing protein [Flavobacteriales bacterium]MBK7113396.1 T9SS type A sorting domain-containing protein [Flavobacteriales bacterium]
MNRSLRAAVLVCLAIGCGWVFTATAQCFPDSSASWCSDDLNNSDFIRIQMLMRSDPDTVILGRTYKRIEEYNREAWAENSVFIQRYYVRSTPDGKGYVMLLDSMQEYLAADVSAAVGDTVHDVLAVWSSGPLPSFDLRNVVVDSIITLENNGVTVDRQFVHAVGVDPLVPYIGHYTFWQAGIGNSTGPLMQLGITLGNTEPICLRVEDTYVYNGNFLLPGLPGIPCECSLLPVGIESRTNAQPTIGPNPSTGLFNFTTSQRVLEAIIFDPQGRRILRTKEQYIDLTGCAPGLYTAVVTTTHGSQTVRLVVLRE